MDQNPSPWGAAHEHSMHEAPRSRRCGHPGLADREDAYKLVFMDDGVIVEEGVPSEVLANPQHERTQSFLSKVL